MALKDVIIGYAKGDKGDKGDTGERGATGQTGPQGEPGNIADAEITDTQGLDVDKGAKTTAQKLFDAITDRIVNKLVSNEALTEKLASYLLKSAMSSTNVNSTSNVPTSALLYSLMSDVNNNLSNKFINVSDKGYTQLSQLMDVGAWSKSFVFEIPYTSPIAPATNNTVGIAERGMLHAFDYSGKHFYCNDSSKGWQASPYALKSDLFSRNWITNPNTCTTPFSVVNGWSHDLVNVPDDAKNTWNSLQTTWLYPTDIGDLTKVRLQILITGNNTVHTRMYENGNFENWS
nr:collagen-like protein [Clostridium sp. Marseille-P7770]